MEIMVKNLLDSLPRIIMWAILLFSIPLSIYCQGYAGSGSEQAIEGKTVVQIPFKISSGLILVSVRINESKELALHLDTGMSAPIVALFHKESIAEIGLQNTQQVLLGGAGGSGQKSGHLVQDVTIRLGDLEMPDQTLVVMDESRADSPWRVDGVIGRTLFDSYLTRIDYETSAITLYDPSTSQVKNPLAAAIPISLDISGIPTIETQVNIDGKEGKTLKLVLDLGHRNALFLNENKSKGIKPPERIIGGIAGRGIQGEVFSKVGRIQTIKLGSYTLRDIPTSFLAEGVNMGLNREVVDGDIGQSIFRRFHIILDYRNKRMFLTPNKYFGAPNEIDMAGFGFLEQDRDGIFTVQHVMENSPASESGIRKGDKILKINSRDAREYDYYQVYDLLRQNGKTISLTIERGKERLEKTLTLRRLL